MIGDKITIGKEDFEEITYEVYSKTNEEDRNTFTPNDGLGVIFYKRVKKEEPKFPKVFENYRYVITVTDQEHINIHSEFENIDCGFGKGGSLEMLKEAIAYQEANKDVVE